MARFQAQTNAVLDAELEELRTRLGLRANQKADLLRELAALASWVIRQAADGRTVEARGDDGVQVLVHPAVERFQPGGGRRSSAPGRLAIDDAEVRRLAEILDQGFSPTPALREALARLADPDRSPPVLSWRQDVA